MTQSITQTDITDMKVKLLEMFCDKLDAGGAYVHESLNTIQDVARLFGWEDSLASMQKYAKREFNR